MSDFTLGDTIYHKFTTRAFATGVPTALAGSPTLEIYENDSVTPIVEGAGKLVLTQNLNSINGYNLATITATSGNGFEAGKSYSLMLKTGTVGGTSVVGEAIWEFTLQASAAAADLANGTDGLGAIKTDTAAILADTGTDGVVVVAASRPGIRKNTALAAFEFLMTDSTNHTPATGLTVTATRSIDGGAFAAGTLSAVTAVSNGVYSVDFGAADLNGTVITLRCTATGADDLFVTIKTSP